MSREEKVREARAALERSKRDNLIGVPGCGAIDALRDSVEAILSALDGEGRQEEEPCAAKLWHGPGHQSSTPCELEAGHNGPHRCVYGSLGQVATWRTGDYTNRLRQQGIEFNPKSYPDDMGMTGFLDEPPEDPEV